MASSTESSPLLKFVCVPGDDEENVKPTKSPLPLPKMQLLVLCIMRFSEPVSFEIIFPFINEMLRSVGIENPGYYSGLVEGSFAFAQLCTVYFWGSFSDRYGRRPVLLFGLAGVAICTLLFGLSRSFTTLFLFRVLGGAFTGNATILRSAVAEITDETTQGRAFSSLQFSWSIGALVAPAIGGALARPAERFPSLKWNVFTTFPYLLPCLVGAFITFVGWLAGFLFFKETLTKPTHRPPRHCREDTSESTDTLVSGPSTYGSMSAGASASTLTLNNDEPAEEEQKTMTPLQVLRDTIIRRILVSHVFMVILVSSIEALWVLWLYMPVSKGGVGFKTPEIGVILMWDGILATLINLFIFPALQLRAGTVRLYRSTTIINVLLVILFPVVSHVAVWEARRQPQVQLALDASRLGVKAGVALMVVLKASGALVFPCMMILVNQAAPSRTSLGSVNGVAQMAASATRSIGPTLATFLFALSTDPKHRLLGGHLIWVHMLILSLMALFASARVQEGREQRCS